MIPKEFERSNLAFELKAGKKRLELVLHGLTDEQCGMAGAVGSDSISELVSRVIKNEFLALNEAYERLSGSDKQSSDAERQTRFVDRRRHAVARSIQSLLMSFGSFLVSRMLKAILSASAKRFLADLTRPGLLFIGARSGSGNNGLSSQNE